MKFRDILKRLTRPISLEHLTDYEVYDDGDRFRTGKVILPTAQIDTDTGRLKPTQWVKHVTQTSTGTQLNSITTGGDNEDELWEIVSIAASGQMDANAGDRYASVKLLCYTDVTGLTVATVSWKTGNSTLSAGQEWNCSAGVNAWTLNDNGVVSTTANSCLPITVYPGSTIQTELGASYKAGDITRLDVFYKVVGYV